MGFTIENEAQRRMKRPRVSRPMAHIPYGWPHYREGTQRCMCIDNCCQDDNGCRCKSCECRVRKDVHYVETP